MLLRGGHYSLPLDTGEQSSSLPLPLLCLDLAWPSLECQVAGQLCTGVLVKFVVLPVKTMEVNDDLENIHLDFDRDEVCLKFLP